MRVAVVGAGVSGLTTALLMSKRGHDVCLIEARDALGGVAQTMTFAGHTFCPGPQYLWGFDDDGPARRILKSVDIHVDTLTLPTDFERVAIGAAPFKVAGDDVDLTPPNVAAFVNDLDALGRAGESISKDASFQRSGAAMLRAVAEDADRSWSDLAVVARCRSKSVAALAKRHNVDDETLRRVAYAQGIFGESLHALSAVVFAAARHHLVRPLQIPRGGVKALVDALTAAVWQRPSIRVLTGTHVTAIESRGRGHAVWMQARAASSNGSSNGSSNPSSNGSSNASSNGSSNASSNGSSNGSSPASRNNVPASDPLVVDHVVFCCSPGAAAKIHPALKQNFAPANPIGTLVAEASFTDDEQAFLRHKNFTWYASNADVDFEHHAGATRTVNFISPTVNAFERGTTQVVCAFFPTARSTHETKRTKLPSERMTSTNDDRSHHANTALVEELLSRALSRPVTFKDTHTIGPRQWDATFGAHEGAVYGRRLTPASLRQSLTDNLPDGFSMAHSGAGIPGFLGCVQMADAVTRRVSP